MIATRWLAVLFVLMFAGMMAVLVVAPKGFGVQAPTAGQRAPSRSDACFISQKFVRERLKAPTTAKFPAWTEENCRVTRAGEIWRVRSFVDAQNSFGAMIRSDYGVEMTHNPQTDTWTLHDITILAP